MYTTYTSTSQHFGALPFLGDLWNQPIFVVFLFVFFIDFGVISALMRLEEEIKPPKRARHHFLSFWVNDTIVLPPYLMLAAVVMQRADHVEGWYTSTWWQWTALAVGFLISGFMELASGFSWREEIGPAKLYHTFIFGIMGYWLITGTIALFANYTIAWELVSAVAFSITWVCVLVQDASRGMPQNAHPAFSYTSREWISWPDD